jgi:hypothetical protein
MDTSYRASTIKHRRRTQSEVDQLDAQIIEVLRADHPHSVRHVGRSTARRASI